mgnify:FL=1
MHKEIFNEADRGTLREILTAVAQELEEKGRRLGVLRSLEATQDSRKSFRRAALVRRLNALLGDSP